MDYNDLAKNMAQELTLFMQSKRSALSAEAVMLRQWGGKSLPKVLTRAWSCLVSVRFASRFLHHSCSSVVFLKSPNIVQLGCDLEMEASASFSACNMRFTKRSSRSASFWDPTGNAPINSKGRWRRVYWLRPCWCCKNRLAGSGLIPV